MKNFITENNISFEPGSRNTSVTTLIGYAQFNNLTKEQLKTELSTEIKNDSFISEEIDRLWNYCKDKNYKSFWNSEEAKMQYTF